ncbi:hypothetical protein AC578_3858 [Pseudocercospora eumusae]|uniref:Uncharacterized protein n=1 Tax=Pseudocercospora eumusae TaxID=321146 RepID=A0A139GWY6_9PEZI|nr:hypothetical protein AC578_3858 [Pseudocercospora eumusae]
MLRVLHDASSWRLSVLVPHPAYREPTAACITALKACTCDWQRVRTSTSTRPSEFKTPFSPRRTPLYILAALIARSGLDALANDPRELATHILHADTEHVGNSVADITNDKIPTWHKESVRLKPLAASIHMASNIIVLEGLQVLRAI